MAHLKIATFNCAGLSVTTRRKAIFDYLPKLDAQIICLQETHSTALDEHKWAVEWGNPYALFHSNKTNDRSNGVAFLINYPDISLTNWHGDQHGRVVTADFKASLRKLHITNIYAPQSGYSKRERTLFFDSLYSYVHSPHPTILAGDFNCVENPALDRNPPANRQDFTTPLRELRETLGLQDTLRAAYGDVRLFTRRHANVQSRIDRFYACSKITPLSEQALPGLASDHDIVVIETNTVITPKHGKGRWKNNTAIYNDQTFQTRFQHQWEQWCTLQPYFFHTKTDWWSQTKTRIQRD